MKAKSLCALPIFIITLLLQSVLVRGASDAEWQKALIKRMNYLLDEIEKLL